MNQQVLRLETPDSACFASFYPGPNRSLLRQLESWCADEDTGQIFLVGPHASGKTHLAQSACRALWDAGRQAAYLPLRQISEFAAGLVGLPVRGLIAIDDIGDLASSDELSLMRLIDASRAADGRLLIAGERWPDQLQLATPDLRSRLQWGAVFELKLLADADLAAMLEQRCRQRGVGMTPRAIEYLIRRVRRDPGSLLTAFDAAYTLAIAQGRQLTVPLLRQVLDAPAIPTHVEQTADKPQSRA